MPYKFSSRVYEDPIAIETTEVSTSTAGIIKAIYFRKYTTSIGLLFPSETTSSVTFTVYH